MMLQEIIDRSFSEAEEGTAHSAEIARNLQSMGYKKLGSGTDATVWAKEKGYVIKILMPDEPNSRAEQVFQRFYEFCKQNSDIACLPRFNAVNKIQIFDREYTQIDMERLLPLRPNSFEEGMVWYLSDYATKNIPWAEVKQALSSHHLWINTNWHKVAREMANKVSNFSAKENAVYSLLYTAMTLLYHTGRINKFGWDLHTENVMRRRNGQLVIIDPWFHLAE
jgi:hypothetical protein